VATRGSVIVVFGITGDLSKRKLLPALYHLLSHDELAEDTTIIGISRKALTVDDLLGTVELCVLEKDKVCDPIGLARVRASLRTQQLDPTEPEDFVELKNLLDSLDADGARERLFYLSVPAEAYAPIVENLAASGLNGPTARVLLEKPFGYDSESARSLLELVNSNFGENQVYRIDHYLTKETAQNLLAFRLHNPIFSPLWTSQHIHRVHITASETIGIEGRADFYEQTGALRDLIQSHLIQLLCITLMDLPHDMSSDAIHMSKQHFIEQLQPADPTDAVRGQYSSYRAEVQNPESTVETYAKIHLRHAAERWRGTDIVLETGKGLASKTTEITIEFKNPHEPRRNNLTFHIQPNEGIGLDLVVKQPGFENHMHHTALDFRYAETFKHVQAVDAYERVLTDAIRGDQSLFASDREVMASWRVLQPVLDAWAATGEGLQFYESGTDGPA
jgi:glucose-6-phosphate 1-dehydrogenase